MRLDGIHKVDVEIDIQNNIIDTVSVFINDECFEDFDGGGLQAEFADTLHNETLKALTDSLNSSSHIDLVLLINDCIKNITAKNKP